jgi:hypothetical protein
MKVFIIGNVLEEQTKRIEKTITQNLDQFGDLNNIFQFKVPNIDRNRCQAVSIFGDNSNKGWAVLQYYQVQVDEDMAAIYPNNQQIAARDNFLAAYARLYLVQNIISTQLNYNFVEISYQPQVYID